MIFLDNILHRQADSKHFLEVFQPELLALGILNSEMKQPL